MNLSDFCIVQKKFFLCVNYMYNRDHTDKKIQLSVFNLIVIGKKK